MILARLTQYYHSLLQEQNYTLSSQMPPYGFSKEKIGAVLVLSSQGKLLDVYSHTVANGNKALKPRTLIVPRPEKRTSGVQPNFLWDKSAYVLGIEAKPERSDDGQPAYVIQPKPLMAFKQYHSHLLQQTSDIGLRAVYLFLQQWQPEMFAELTARQQSYILSMNLVFMLADDQKYIHQRSAARDLWLDYLTQQNPVTVNCLIDGSSQPLAMLHSPIKHIHGASSLGVSLVSFNQNAFTSYGKKQGHNAPISAQSAFAYTATLNYLLSQTGRQCCHFSDLNIVFWIHGGNRQSICVAEIIFREIMGLEDAKVTHPLQIATDLTAKSVEKHGMMRFCVLGLIPNSARLAMRLWVDEPVKTIEKYLIEYRKELSILNSAKRRIPHFGQLLQEISPYGQIEHLPLKFIGDWLMAILTGKCYPTGLLSMIMMRIRTDRGRHKITRLRIILVQAVLQRHHRLGLIKQHIPISLDTENRQCAYLLGRLFAVFAHIQRQVIKSLYSNIIDSYYGIACATPAAIFPRLVSMYEQQWLALVTDHTVLETSDQLLKQLLHALPVSCRFPSQLNLVEQGQFTLGYEHQRVVCVDD